jgi:cellulose synthase/poly-beta-1,6-N-acetylglucosamine synthase-like glycosyltransferase
MNLLSLFLHPSAAWLLWIVSFILILYAGYYFVLSLFALKPYRPVVSSKPTHRFALVIAARNEALVIANLIHSLKQQNYPASLYEIFVIPNHCTDDTEAIARKAGASILHCSADVKSKGEVLSHAFQYFMSSQDHFDAYCIFDADNLAGPDFLKEMNDLLCAGIKAAQGRRESKNPSDSVISSCYTIYYNNLNRFYNHARNAVGLSSVVNGTGFMFHHDVIRRLGGWNTVTLTEDLEFSALCSLNGINIHWAPRAVFFDEQPLTFLQSWHQRKRWSSGMQQCLSKYWKALLSDAIKNKNPNSSDILLMFLATHIQVIGFFSFLMTLSLTAMHISYNLFPQTDLAFRLLVSFDTSYFSTVIIAVAALLLERKNPLKHLRGILFTWLFLASWIPINCLCLVRKTDHWRQIDHVKSISLKDILSLQAD